MLFCGELVNLRAIKDEDLKLAAEYLNDPEIIYNLEDGAPFPESYESQREWLERMRKEKENHKKFFVAIETKDGKYIGSCDIGRLDQKNRNVQIGIFIGDKAYLGKGYGTDALKLLVKFLFEEYNVNKVKLNVFAFNQRAIKCYEKCGFKTEAVRREALFRYGTYHDVIVMAVLKEEYFLNR